MGMGMEIFTKAMVVLVIISLLVGFFKKFTTRSSKNMYSDAEYGRYGPPEEYHNKGIMGKIKNRGGKGGSGGGGSAPSGGAE